VLLHLWSVGTSACAGALLPVAAIAAIARTAARARRREIRERTRCESARERWLVTSAAWARVMDIVSSFGRWVWVT
jgi:hypothetical protein